MKKTFVRVVATGIAFTLSLGALLAAKPALAVTYVPITGTG
jgi:hypothetical protein